MESIALFVTHIINTGLHNYASLSPMCVQIQKLINFLLLFSYVHALLISTKL